MPFGAGHGSEVPYARKPEGRRWERHREMNCALEEVLQDFPNVSLCDVRRFIQTPHDHSHNIRHYTRQGYFRIAGELNRLISLHCGIQPGLAKRLLVAAKFLRNLRFKHLVRRLLPVLSAVVAHDELLALALLFAGH